MEIVPQLLLVIALVLLNGYFVASEFALVAVRKTRIQELVKQGSPAAKLVLRALEHLDTYISSTQLGITLASLALGWVGEPFLAHLIEPLFSSLPLYIAAISAHTLAVIAAFGIITFLHIVLGELAPKTVALQRAETVSQVIIAPLIVFTTIFKPFIWILNGAGNIVLKLFNLHAPTTHTLVHSEEEIKMILFQSAQGGAIPQKEAEMVYSIFKLGELPVKQIMVPRTEIMAFSAQARLRDVLRKVRKTQHSRFPVYDTSVDSIIGFIHIKDVFYKGFIKSNLEKKLSQTHIIRDVLSVPETKRADEVLVDMRRKRVHLAVVIDEYGGTSGIVTLENIIEGVVGEIDDEFDPPIKDIRKQADGSYLIDGRVSIERIQEEFNFPVKGQGYMTLGGFVFGLLGHEPTRGDMVQIGSLQFTIEDIEKHRIKTIRISKESRGKRKKKKK